MLIPDKKVSDYTRNYSDYYPMISGIVYSRLRDHHGTHDVCQEIFTRYFIKYDEIDNHRSWLLGTMKLVLLEHYRKRGGDHEDLDTVSDDITMSFVNGFRDTRLMIEEALEDMGNFGSEINRVIFDLIALQNYTYKEAGQSLGLSERQIRYRYNQVVDNLMGYFRQRGIHGLEDLL